MGGYRFGFKLKHKISFFLIAVLGVSLIGVAPVVAADTVTTACVTTKTGAIRILLKGTCKAKVEKKISWKSNGVRGIRGVQGIQGIQGIQGAQGLTGPAGINGPAGADGKNGVDGKNGNTIWYGTTPPAANIGVAGDFYVNTVTNFWFGPKTTVWPAGISLVGPMGAGPAGATGATGPVGATGATGPAGPTGQSGYSSLWFTPNDLRLGINGDTSTVTSILITTPSQYFEEVLDIDQDRTKFFFRAVPKGWSSATSTTWKIYWTTDGVGAKVGFDLFLNTGEEGSNIRDIPPGCNVGCSSATQKDPLGVNLINVTTITLPNSVNMPGRMIENGLLHIGFSRTSSLYNGDNTFTDNGLYQGKVYVFGMSATANF